MNSSVRLCVFEVAGAEYAIDVGRVDEVVGEAAITPFSPVPPFVLGVAPFRGSLVPVIDVRRRLGFGANVGEPSPRPLVVCRVGRWRVGLCVDAVRDVIAVDRGDIRVGWGGTTDAAFIVGVVGQVDRLRLLLDLVALVGDAG